MAMEDRETFSLIGSDKGHERVRRRRAKGRLHRARHDRQDQRQGVIRGAQFRRGLLGIGDDHYPLPWQALKYDTNLGGYVTGITQDQLRGAPKYADESSWNWSDPATARSVNAYYGVPVA